jgi:hypothetical protein
LAFFASAARGQRFRNQDVSAELTGMQWIEALINLSAFAGFIGIANVGCKNQR